MSIAKAYNHWSKIYDSNENKTRDLDAKATREVLENIDFQDVLEMGCGTGKNTAWLSGRAKSVIGFDFSEGMLAEARLKITAPNVEFRQADLTKNWPVADASADLITFNLVLEHIEDLDFICRQAAEKLHPGGRLFICELHPFKQYRGSKARFETDEGAVQMLDVFIHNVSDFVAAGMKNGLQLLDLREWWDADATSEDVPRLLSLLFGK